MYIFFFRKPLFFLEFSRNRFKKITKQKQKQLDFFDLRSPSVLIKTQFLKNLKKNSISLSLKTSFLKKSLFNNKFFLSSFFLNKRLYTKKVSKFKNFKKKSLFSLNKFFIKFINKERYGFLTQHFLKNKKQKTTTKFISTLSKLTPFFYKLFLEFNLLTILIRSRLSLSKTFSKFLVSNNMVYINYALTTRFSTTLNKADLIQLVFIKSYFFFFKYSYNLIHKRLSKLNYCVWRLQLSKKRKGKQQITTLPTWLKTIFYFPYSIPKYLEVDFITLSCIILRNPLTINEFNPQIYWNNHYYFYRLMNWKWLT